MSIRDLLRGASSRGVVVAHPPSPYEKRCEAVIWPGEPYKGRLIGVIYLGAPDDGETEWLWDAIPATREWRHDCGYAESEGAARSIARERVIAMTDEERA